MTGVASEKFGCSPPVSPEKVGFDLLQEVAELTFDSSDLILDAEEEEEEEEATCEDKRDCSSVANMKWHQRKVWCVLNNADGGGCARTCGHCSN